MALSSDWFLVSLSLPIYRWEYHLLAHLTVVVGISEYTQLWVSLGKLSTFVQVEGHGPWLPQRALVMVQLRPHFPTPFEGYEFLTVFLSS